MHAYVSIQFLGRCLVQKKESMLVACGSIQAASNRKVEPKMFLLAQQSTKLLSSCFCCFLLGFLLFQFLLLLAQELEILTCCSELRKFLLMDLKALLDNLKEPDCAGNVIGGLNVFLFWLGI